MGGRVGGGMDVGNGCGVSLVSCEVVRGAWWPKSAGLGKGRPAMPSSPQSAASPPKRSPSPSMDGREVGIFRYASSGVACVRVCMPASVWAACVESGLRSWRGCGGVCAGSGVLCWPNTGGPAGSGPPSSVRVHVSAVGPSRRGPSRASCDTAPGRTPPSRSSTKLAIPSSMAGMIDGRAAARCALPTCAPACSYPMKNRSADVSTADERVYASESCEDIGLPSPSPSAPSC